MAIIAIVVIAGGAILYQFILLPSPPKVEVASKEKMAFPLPEVPSIAVLPFVNMSGDPKQEFLCEGITGEIITTLSRVPGLVVIARTSTFTYKGKPVKVKQVSEELGVRYVLEGGVQRSADRIRINAQLIDAITGSQIWAERYERNLKDIFALQDEINLKILTAIRVKLTAGEQALKVEVFGSGQIRSTCHPRGHRRGPAVKRTIYCDVSGVSDGLSLAGLCPPDRVLDGLRKVPSGVY
jgi:TolB-like protein